MPGLLLYTACLSELDHRLVSDDGTLTKVTEFVLLMKASTSLFRALIVAVAALLWVNWSTALAAETNPPVIVVPPSDSTAQPAPKLPYGVQDVLKLSRADVSQDIILNYVRNSGIIYNLSPQDIVYLKSQGVTDPVLNAMLDQRNRLAAQNQVPPAPAPAPDVSAGAQAYDSGQASQAPAVQAPLTPPASSTYVIPYGGYSYYDYYPYYGPYYGAWGPSVVLGFGYYGHGYYGYHGGFHGGYHGGYRGGGGYHGGGFHGGGGGGFHGGHR